MSKFRHTNLAIFAGQFGYIIVHTCFLFYYVKVFLNVFKVSEYWFNIAQFLYMIWNTINDPIFGYLQDVGGTWMKSRSKVFLWFGPPLSLSFLVLWFPWGDENSPPWVEGLHLIVALFLYDAFFSCVGVAWGALFTESTKDHRKRVKALKYAQMAVLCSASVIVIAEKVSHSLDDYQSFQYLCVIISIISCVCLYIAGKLSSENESTMKEKLLDEDKEPDQQTLSGILKLTKELIGSKDFQLIIFTNFIHSCRSVAHINFASIAVETIIPQKILPRGSWQIGAFFAASTLLPQILMIANERLIVKKGAYRIMIWSPFVVMFFMIIDSIMVHSSAPFFNIFLAEFIEDDAARNSRKNTLSSVVFSLNALITKPASSITPVIIVYFLNRNGYEIYQHSKETTPELSLCMLRIIFLTPLILGAIQLAIFRKYSIRHHQSNPALPL
ncbi:hypothetical protein FO519_005098 [Halicephalobus sp. NKZ332]|nr:hypothetical protein FO519_005098 [Halicephalobus sp. NKZ332]